MEDVTKNAHMPIPGILHNALMKKPVNNSASSSALSDLQMENIIGYIHGHKNTQMTTLSASEAGIGALKDMQKKLDLAGDELLRIEDEGGAPLSARQTAEVSTYLKESRNIGKALKIAKNKPMAKIQRESGHDDGHSTT